MKNELNSKQNKAVKMLVSAIELGVYIDSIPDENLRPILEHPEVVDSLKKSKT